MVFIAGVKRALDVLQEGLCLVCDPNHASKALCHAVLRNDHCSPAPRHGAHCGREARPGRGAPGQQDQAGRGTGGCQWVLGAESDAAGGQAAGCQGPGQRGGAQVAMHSLHWGNSKIPRHMCSIDTANCKLLRCSPFMQGCSTPCWCVWVISLSQDWGKEHTPSSIESVHHRALSSAATVMLRNPGQTRGGRQQGGGPWIESLWPGWRNDALFGGSQWEALSLLHAAAWQA
eukprot:1160014-Pelagomonas_calceolata.AAC.9